MRSRVLMRRELDLRPPLDQVISPGYTDLTPRGADEPPRRDHMTTTMPVLTAIDDSYGRGEKLLAKATALRARVLKDIAEMRADCVAEGATENVATVDAMVTHLATSAVWAEGALWKELASPMSAMEAVRAHMTGDKAKILSPALFLNTAVRRMLGA